MLPAAATAEKRAQVPQVDAERGAVRPAYNFVSFAFGRHRLHLLTGQTSRDVLWGKP